MNKTLATILRNKIKQAPFIDLFGGLVSVQETIDLVQDERTGQERRVAYRFPVTADIFYPQDISCKSIGQSLYDVSPNTNFKGISYFEDLGTQLLQRQNAWFVFNSRLRLVCWVNTSKFEAVQAVLMADLMARLTGNPFNEAPLSAIAVTVSSIPQSGKGLFSAYTFNEAVSQYLMPPFEAFALDLSVNYRISANCLPPIYATEQPC